MRSLLFILLLGAATVSIEYPTVNLPVGDRQENWTGDQGQGCCVFATTVSLLRWEGQYDLADRIRKKYGNGESLEGLAAKLDREGIRYAYAIHDVHFLEWALKTRRGCGIPFDTTGPHCLALVYLDNKLACLLDNNDVGRYRWMSREKFLKHWIESGGWAFALVYDPIPPMPS